MQSLDVFRRLGLEIPADDLPGVTQPGRMTPATSQRRNQEKGRPMRRWARHRGRVAGIRIRRLRSAAGCLASPTTRRPRKSRSTATWRDCFSGSATPAARRAHRSQSRAEARARIGAAQNVEPARSTTPESPGESTIARSHPRGAFTPRALAPKTTIDLSAMRELANMSAKAAIDRQCPDDLGSRQWQQAHRGRCRRHQRHRLARAGDHPTGEQLHGQRGGRGIRDCPLVVGPVPGSCGPAAGRLISKPLAGYDFCRRGRRLHGDASVR